MPKKRKTEPEKPEKKDYSDKPWVSNYPPLQDWLRKHEARCMWQWPCGEPPSDPDERYGWTPVAYVECWMVNLKTIFLVVHARKMGWEIYTALDSPKVDETLREVERRLGIITEERAGAIVVKAEVTGDTLSDVEAGIEEVRRGVMEGCHRGADTGEDGRSYQFEVDGEEDENDEA